MYNDNSVIYHEPRQYQAWLERVNAYDFFFLSKNVEKVLGLL